MRTATADDVDGLLAMERSTNLVMLAHVFPPERFEYPTAEVRARWQRVLSEASYSCLIATVDEVDAGYVAWAGDVIHHLGVHPNFHRRGVGTHLLASAENVIFARHELAHLWVLIANTSAVQLYARNGWQKTALRRRAEFPPFPLEVQMSKRHPLGGSDPA